MVTDHGKAGNAVGLTAVIQNIGEPLILLAGFTGLCSVSVTAVPCSAANWRSAGIRCLQAAIYSFTIVSPPSKPACLKRSNMAEAFLTPWRSKLSNKPV